MIILSVCRWRGLLDNASQIVYGNVRTWSVPFLREAKRPLVEGEGDTRHRVQQEKHGQDWKHYCTISC